MGISAQNRKRFMKTRRSHSFINRNNEGVSEEVAQAVTPGFDMGNSL
jgi:hypothetical protein